MILGHTDHNHRRAATSLKGFLVLTVALLWLGCCGEARTVAGNDESPVDSGRKKLSEDWLGRALIVSPDAFDFTANPELLKRILAGPHPYFRFINNLFSLAVCSRFCEGASSFPIVNLHGDAHLEQYAITDSGRGLTDFDRATQGRAFIDYVRFGVSVHLACRANGWTAQASEVVREFFRGYLAALDNPGLPVSSPDLVNRVREGFTNERPQVLALAESFMVPTERSEEEISESMKEYVSQMRDQYPELPSSFFSIKRIGGLRLGIGSALDEKYLMRIEGETVAPEDDLILEAKQIRKLDHVECIEVAGSNPERIIKGQSRLSYQPQRYVGFFSMLPLDRGSGKTNFWVFAWDDHYQELSIDQSFRSVEELMSIVFDVGIQLGLGHPRELSSHDDSMLRRALAQVTRDREEDLLQTIEEFAAYTVLSWERFCLDSELSH